MAEPVFPRPLRLTAALAAFACALPMLLRLPYALAILLTAVFAIGLLSQRHWPGWLRLVLTIALVGAALTGYAPRIGRDGASALLVAMLALKTLELNSSRDARSLVGFALFVPFAAFLQDQGPLTLGLSLPAAVAVLMAMQALADPDDADNLPRRWRAHARQALIGLALALPLAMVAFWLFPRLASPLWGMPDNAQARTGMSDRMSPGDWLDVMTDDTPAFRVRFSGTPPPLQQLYWRGPVLGQFDGRTWTRAEWMIGLPRPEVISAAPGIDYEITLDATDRRFLFGLDLPEQVSVAARIGGDGSLLADAPVRSLLRYRGRSIPPQRFEPQLGVALRQNFLRLPDNYNPRTLALARRWRAEGADDAAMVGRFLDWVRKDFSYSLETPLLGRNSIDEFLFDVRVGYCEHFSAAFVVMMRAAGLPARVVTGYAGGYRNPIGDYWLVRQSDAHAWAEVWLPERGWVRVDPTAAVAPERVFEPASALNTEGALAALRQAGDIGDWARDGWNDLLLQFNAARQRALLRPLGIDDASAWQLSAAFTVAAGLALAFTLLVLLRGERRPADPVLRGWLNFQRQLARAGLPKAADEPAQTFGERVAQALPAQSEQLRSLSRRFVDWRYGVHSQQAGTATALARDLSNFRILRRPSSGASP